MKNFRSLNSNKNLFFVGIILGVSILGYFLLNKAAEKAYEIRKDEIEKKLGASLNKKVELGDYLGIRLFGLALANSKIIEKENINSKIEAKKIYLGIMPIKSFINQKFVIKIKPNKTKIQIDNDFFKIEDLSIKNRDFNNKNIKFDLNFELNKFSNLYLNDFGIGSKIKGKILYRSTNQQFIGNINAYFRDKGKMKLKINTKLKQKLFSVRVLSNGINLKDSDFNIFNRKFKLSNGTIKSNFNFSKSTNETYCKGSLSLNELKFNSSPFLEDVNTDSIRIFCKKNNLVAQTNKLNYGTLSSDLKINVPLNQKINNINLKGNIGYLDSSNPEINLSGNIPYWFDKRGLNLGNLNSRFNLNRTQLSNLNFFRSNNIRGFITAKGELNGEVNDPNILIKFNVDYPQYEAVRIREIWEGEINNKNKEYSLNMKNRSSPIPSFLSLKFDDNIQFKNLIFSRIFNSNEGSLNIIKTDDDYVWEANNFPLDELELSLNDEEFNRISGIINGLGSISLDRSNYNGRIAWSLGKYKDIKLENSLFNFNIGNKSSYINSSLYPINGGEINILYDSNNYDIINVRFNNISTNWSLLTAFDILNFEDSKIVPKGNSNVLDDIYITTEGKSLKEQIAFINGLLDNNLIENEKFNLKKYLTNFESRYSGNLVIGGTNKSNYKIYTRIDAYLEVYNNFSNEISKEDFSFELEGGLFEGKGSLKVYQLPLKTFNIFLNKPKDLTGNLDFNLFYDLDKNSFSASVFSNKTSIKDYSLTIDEGNIKFKDSLFDINFALLLNNSTVPINLSGFIPINNENNLDLRINSNGQFIDLIDIFYENDFNFKKGNVYLKMIIKGSLNKPIANGFLIIEDSVIDIYKNTIKDINSTILFDFDQIEIINFNARSNDSGIIFIQGSLPFYDEFTVQDKSINFLTGDFKIENKNINFIFDSNINISGSFENLFLSGEAGFRNGFINFNNRNNKNEMNKKNKKSKSERNWPELNWDNDKTIELISNESILSSSLLWENLPNYLEKISFNNLKLKLGPDFRIQYSEIVKTNLDTKLDLNFKGRIGKDLKARGLIELSKGRANLYTTPFKLDNNKENYIVFGSRSGIVPYINFSLTSRVPDSIIPISQNNEDLNISNNFNSNSNPSGFGAFGIGNTRLIKIDASYKGFLDQLSFEDENKRIQLRSTPSYSRSQIIGLIGGNSSNLINRAFISQLNGANAFNERFQLSLYPVLIENNESISNVFSSENLDIEDEEEISSYDAYSSQAWVAEIGLDITNRINFAVQATPDRTDLAPLGILTLQANPNLELLGSIDSDGDWKSQVQLFLRY